MVSSLTEITLSQIRDNRTIIYAFQNDELYPSSSFFDFSLKVFAYEGNFKCDKIYVTIRTGESDIMFKKGDYIIYGSTGVCLVEDITVPDYLKQHGINKDYYRLAPVYRTETIYTPVDTSVFMRSIITKEEADNLILKIPSIQEEHFEIKDHRTLAENYKASIKSHECEDLIRLVKTVYTRSRQMIDSGKKPAQTDMQYMKQAEDLLHGEFAVALDIPITEVPTYISNKLSELK